MDSNLDKSLEKLNEQLSRTGEEIISQDTVDGPDGKKLLVLSVREGKGRSRGKNLLFDQIDRGEMTDVFHGSRVLRD